MNPWWRRPTADDEAPQQPPKERAAREPVTDSEPAGAAAPSEPAPPARQAEPATPTPTPSRERASTEASQARQPAEALQPVIPEPPTPEPTSIATTPLKSPEPPPKPTEAAPTAEPVQLEDAVLVGHELAEKEMSEPETPATEAPKPRRRRPRRRSASSEKANAEPTRKEPDAPDEAKKQGRRRTPQAKKGPEPLTVKEGSEESGGELVELLREVLTSAPARTESTAHERKIALFCDLENIALGVRDSEVKKFDINLVLERLLEKGKIIVKKAYADWERYNEYKRALHSAAIEMIDIPQKYYSGKNSADIKMVVDAMDLCYSKEHLDTFVLLSGDSDFSPLVSKLKENNKYVIGLGVKKSSSSLLIDNCDEFIYYEDVWRDSQRPPEVDGLSKEKSEVFGLMIDAMKALIRDNKDVLWGSMIKQTMQRKRPSFNEGYYGYSTFSDLLQDAERKGLVKLKKDRRSGSLIVTGFGR